MAVNLSPILLGQVLDGNGNPRSGGKIQTFLAGSSTPATTYKDAAGAVPQANPIILNTLGAVTDLIYLTSGTAYKLVLKDSLDAVIATYDNIVGVNDVAGTIDQYQVFSQTPTYVSPTQFTLSGDQTSSFTVGRILKLSVTAGIVYATVTASAFGALTTVTVAGAALDAGLSTVSLSILTSVNISVPTVPTATVIASAATLDLRGVKSRYVHISGTVATSSVLLLNGQEVTVIADAAWPLTYNATTNNISGLMSYTLSIGEMVEYSFDGAVVRGAIVRGGRALSYIRLNTANGYGSTNTMIRRFTNIVNQFGGDITYADSATLGGSFTINTSDTYSISYSDQFSAVSGVGITLNTTTPLTSIGSVAVGEILGVATTAAANLAACATFNGFLAAGSVVRAHAAGAASGTQVSFCHFSIARTN